MLRLLASGEGPALTSACLSAGRLAHRRYQTAAPPQRLGFVGLGIMGTAMATNLVKAGHEVTVWNRCAPCVTQGGGRPRGVRRASGGVRRDALEEGEVPPSRAPSLRPATVPLTASVQLQWHL